MKGIKDVIRGRRGGEINDGTIKRKRKTSHQDGSEDSRADSVCHLKLSFLIGSSEIVVPPRTEHPGGKERGAAVTTEKSTRCSRVMKVLPDFTCRLHLPASETGADCNVMLLPAQHGVGMSGEDGGIHHESCVVHDERDSFSRA